MKNEMTRQLAISAAVATVIALLWVERGHLRWTTSGVTDHRPLIEKAQLGFELPDRLTAQGAGGTPTAAATPVAEATAAPKIRRFNRPHVSATPVVPVVASAPPMQAVPPAEPTVSSSPVSVLWEMGAAFSSAAVSPAVDNSCCRAGFLIGARAEWGLSDAFSLMPGLRFVQKGGRANIGGSNVEVALDYLEIPLQVKYRFRGQDFRPFVFGGPTLGFITSAQGTAYGVSRDLKPSTQTLDATIDGGIGAEMIVDRRWSAFLSAAYSFGLLDVDSTSDAWHSRSFQFTGGIKYTWP